MSRLHERVVEMLLLAIMTIAGGMVLQGVVRGENAGCANLTCKVAWNIYWCDTETGVLYKDQPDCLVCSDIGRCVNGNAAACLGTDEAAYFAVESVDLLCDCLKAPNDGGAVEASGETYTGTWQDAVRTYMYCGSS